MQAFRNAEVNTEAPADFITPTVAKDYLGISGSSEDTLVAALIAAASATIEAYCNQYLTVRTVIEAIHLEDHVRSFVLGHPHVIAVASLTYDGTVVSGSTYDVANRTGILRMVDGAGFAPGEYVATYSVGVADVANLPAPVVHACKELVKTLYLDKARNPSIQREAVPDVADVSYAADGANLLTGPNGVALPWHVAALLGPYVQRYRLI